jgi:hypothetical protein
LLQPQQLHDPAMFEVSIVFRQLFDPVQLSPGRPAKRLGAEITATDFTSTMQNRQLAPSKLIDIAIPANWRCGRPDP